ncbi:MAG: prolipoprotein diacylglyceryl transferase [Bacteroidales bacterium]|nr:prolipoprotein diacylglyceryl transferase [Bacteroidales bacterium]
MILNAVIWNANPEIFSLGTLSLRWYGLLFALGFVIGYIIFQNFFKREGISYEYLDKLLVYMAVGTIVGARLGHCFFYDPKYYLSNPLEILEVWKGGLASHGAAIGILLALWLFVRKYKFSYLWLLDRIVITVALAGAFIRTGNLMNSEIYGVATKSTKGFIYVHDLTRQLEKLKAVNTIHYRVTGDSLTDGKALPMEVQVTLGPQLRDSSAAALFAELRLREYLANNPLVEETDFYYSPDKDFRYHIEKNAKGRYVVTAYFFGVPKYPTQIFEALSYFAIFLLLYGFYLKYGTGLNKGFLFGLFLTLVFTARFFIEFIKEFQSAFEANLPLNMGQLLSIPFIVAGIYFIVQSVYKKEKSVHLPEKE